MSGGDGDIAQGDIGSVFGDGPFTGQQQEFPGVRAGHPGTIALPGGAAPLFEVRRTLRCVRKLEEAALRLKSVD
ncbi:hypothetical protein Ntsu_69230 [Nocardia sp. IFM 10818]